MDTTLKYTKMCEEAWKDLKREIELDNIVSYRYTYDDYVHKGIGSYFHIAEYWQIKEENKSKFDFDYIFVLWKQDQLQKMVDWSAFTYIVSTQACQINDFYNTLEEVPDSMEELWLAFVMSKNYFKKWNIKTEKWIKNKGE